MSASVGRRCDESEKDPYAWRYSHSHRLHKTKVQLARKMSEILLAECEILSCGVK